MSAVTHEVRIEPSDEGGYTVTCPTMPGCISEGESIPDALRNFADAVELWNEPEVQ